MGQIVVRKLDERIRQALKERARRHGRSMEAEVRTILAEVVRGEPHAASGGLGTRIASRFDGVLKPGERLALPPRTPVKERAALD